MRERDRAVSDAQDRIVSLVRRGQALHGPDVRDALSGLWRAGYAEGARRCTNPPCPPGSPGAPSGSRGSLPQSHGRGATPDDLRAAVGSAARVLAAAWAALDASLADGGPPPSAWAEKWGGREIRDTPAP